MVQKSATKVARSLMRATTLRSQSLSGTAMPLEARTGMKASASSLSLLLLRYSLLYHLALSGLNFAPAFWTWSMEKACISSSIEKISLSSPGFQPSIASIFTKASGK